MNSTWPHPQASAPTPTTKGRGFSAHLLQQSPRWQLHTWEGQQLGVPVPQASFLIHLRRFAYPGACHPSSPLSLLHAQRGTPQAANPQLGRIGVSTVQVSRQPHRTMCTVRARAEPTPHPLQGLIHQPPQQGEQVCISYFLDTPPKRATHGTYTAPWQEPKGNTGLREMTPALSLRHLRDDLEHSRGTTKGQTRHVHTPTEGRQCSHNTALPTMGRVGRAANRTHTMKAKQEHLCQKTNSPTDAPR